MSRPSLLRRAATSGVGDLDRLVLAGDALRRCGRAVEAADIVAPAAAELARADGAAVHLRSPGHRLQSVRFGAAPVTPPDATLEVVLRWPTPGTTSLAVPTEGSLGAALTIHGSGRPGDPVATNLLTILAQQLGASLDRLSAGTVVPDRLDPLTGVGNRQQATADVATLRAGDAIVLVALDDAEPVGSMWGLASFLRTQTRPPADTIARLAERQLVLVLRDLRAPVGVVADRLLRGWRATEAAPAVVMGAATHGSGAPLETLDRAGVALAGARSLGHDRLHVAPEPRVASPV